ncbi:MAG: ABC transporter ATP-binding protein [Kiritimatiellae bacterium]|nr:ABC transporter ATP-binding protein [Kiritimatiellia bacterium]
MLEVRQLTRTFGRRPAVAGLTFTLDAGICVVAGPNGAGKTTLLRTLVGADRASDGSVLLDGLDVFADPIRAHRHMSYLADTVPLYKDLTVEEHLTYRGRLKGLSGRRLRARLRHVIEALDLKTLATVRTAALSAGQRKRAGIADALLCETRMLLIDEPFAGLDQDHVEPLLDLFATTAKHAIVLLATHNIPAVSRLDGQCLILHAGRLAGLIPLAAEDGEPLERRYADCLENARIEEAAQ